MSATLAATHDGSAAARAAVSCRIAAGRIWDGRALFVAGPDRGASSAALLTAAALEAGYGDAPHLVRDSRQLTGLSPRDLVQRHAR
ncbi:hypothetical protein Y886_09450 [Xanthomonas hyacinthi DSM 19077]|nr:hypothetical protein Y886_09450 [Xanthomonas hyacinthi DSM 19077]